jgi:5-methylthioadenosine/S-adenosylhomocysteine deaminase
MVLFRGLAEDVALDRWFNDYIWPLEHNLTALDVYYGMKLGLAEMLRAGITTVADHYFFVDEIARAVDASGARALLGWAIFSSNGEAAIERTARFCREWRGAANGRIETIMAPHAPYTCDESYLTACANVAKRLGVGIHIHASEAPQQTQASLERYGVTPIQILERCGVLDVPTIIAHACGVLESDIAILARYPVGVAHCAKTYLKMGMPLTPIPELRAAGIPIGLGTDGAVSNNTLNLWEVLRLMAMGQKARFNDAQVMPLAEALYIATRESARVIGHADDLGAIQPGYFADLQLLDLGGLHHQPVHDTAASLVYNTEIADVRTVIVDGQIVVQDGEVRTLDIPEIVAYAQHARPRLAQRDPNLRIQTYQP